MNLVWKRTAVASLAILSASLAHAATGGISGTVSLSGGTAVANAAVLFSQLPTGDPTIALANGFTYTAADGTFSIGGLPDGAYRLCLEAPEQSLLDPCLWSATPPSATVSGGTVAAGVQIAATPGARLNVRVDDDSQGDLAANEDKGPGKELVFGVRTIRGLLHTHWLLGKDNKGKNYRLLLPTGQKVNVVVLTNAFDVMEDGGTHHGKNGTDYVITIPDGAAEKTLHLTIAGYSDPNQGGN